MLSPDLHNRASIPKNCPGGPEMVIVTVVPSARSDSGPFGTTSTWAGDAPTTVALVTVGGLAVSEEAVVTSANGTAVATRTKMAARRDGRSVSRLRICQGKGPNGKAVGELDLQHELTWVARPAGDRDGRAILFGELIVADPDVEH